MEIIENNTGERRVFFPESVFNQGLPLWFKIVLFAIGFLGLQFLSVPVSLLFAATIADLDLANAAVMFLTYFLTCALVLLLLFFLQKKTFLAFLKEFADWRNYTHALATFAGMILLSYLLSLLFFAVPFYGDNDNQSSINQTVISAPVLMFFPIAIFGPILEEFTYRVGLVDTIGKNNRILGIALSALIFGFIHFDWSAIFGYATQAEGYTLERVLNELMNLPSYIGSGAVLGFAYAKTGKLSVPILGHTINNVLSFASIFLA